MAAAASANIQNQWELYQDDLKDNATKAMDTMKLMGLDFLKTNIVSLVDMLKERARLEQVGESSPAASVSPPSPYVSSAAAGAGVPTAWSAGEEEED
jgi:hypothetical protein